MSMAGRWVRLVPILLLLLGSDAIPVQAARMTGEKIVVQNFYYALPGKEQEVYRWRLHASEVRARLGLAVGRVMKRVPGSGGEGEGTDLPDVVWECDYPNAEARESEVARLDKSQEFDEVQAHMQTLIRQFRRAVFTLPSPN